MKIAIIGTRGIPPRYSGVEKSVEEIVTRLAKEEIKFIVYGHSNRALSNKKLLQEYPNTILINTPTIHNKYLETIIATFFATVDVLFRRVDLVHYHCLGPSIFSFIPRLFAKKVIVTIHGLDWKRRKWPVWAKIFLWLCQYPALYFSHVTIVVSKSMKQKFGNKVIYIPVGASFTKISVDKDSELPEIKNCKYILYAGRITEEKGIHCLIKAFNDLQSEMRLIIAGEANFSIRYLNSLKFTANSNIIFTGFLEKDKLAGLCKNAYVMVFPSEIEGLSLSLLDALSYGKCVVTSDIPEFREILGDEGTYFKKGDHVELREKLGWLISHPEVVSDIEKNSKKLINEYNWDNIAVSTGKVYADLFVRGARSNLVRDKRKLD